MKDRLPVPGPSLWCARARQGGLVGSDDTVCDASQGEEQRHSPSSTTTARLGDVGRLSLLDLFIAITRCPIFAPRTISTVCCRGVAVLPLPRLVHRGSRAPSADAAVGVVIESGVVDVVVGYGARWAVAPIVRSILSTTNTTTVTTTAFVTSEKEMVMVVVVVVMVFSRIGP